MHNRLARYIIERHIKQKCEKVSPEQNFIPKT